jgi:glutaredoxin
MPANKGTHPRITLLDDPRIPDEENPLMDLPLLYIKPGCPWCEEVVDWLAQHQIPVHTVVVSGNPDAMREMVDLSGQTKAPTMDWHGEVLADFGVDELVPFLKQRGVV